MKTLRGIIFCILSVVLVGGAVADMDTPRETPYEAKALPLEIQAMVEGGQYENAISALNDFIEGEKKSPDAWNFLGYSLRKVGLFEDSLSAYKKALRLDKYHLGANEYIGELYLTLDKPRKAKKHLKRLRKECGDCEQHAKLAAAIEKYEADS